MNLVLNFNKSCLLLLLLLQIVEIRGSLGSSDPNARVRDAVQLYLDQYFFDKEYPKILPQPPKLGIDYVRRKIVTCLSLAQLRMKEHREVYASEAFQASKRLGVREDDSLRLFLFGDIVACLANINVDLVTQYESSSRHGRELFLSQVEDHVFKRSASTPLYLNLEEENAFASIVDRYLTIGGTKDLPYWVAVTDFLPLSFLSGTLGLSYSVTALIILLGSLFLLDSRALSSKTGAQGASTTVSDDQTTVKGGAAAAAKKRATKRR